ncbi:hypothetical protein GCM10022631_29070 [Deinococcus rubellus]
MCSGALAKPARPEVFKSVDAQAVAFTGQHCSQVDAREPLDGTLGTYQEMVMLMQRFMQSAQAESKGKVTLKTDSSQKNLYLAYMSSNKSRRLATIFYDGQTIYMDLCIIK